MAIGEAGSVTTGSPTENQPITVVLSEALTDPVFAFTATSNGGDDIVIRLTNQTFDADGNVTSFTFIMEEWEYLDGPHPVAETINWLAIEEGVHTLPDGRIIEAGTTDISSTARNTGGSETFEADFTDPPVVLTSVMSNNDTTTIDSDPSSITADGFNLTLQEEEGQDGVHASETIGWIAIQAGGDVANGTASVSGDTVTHNVSTLSLGGTFTNGVVLAETQTLDGPDTATVSIDSQTGSTVGVFIDEEQSLNDETNHTTEVVGIIAFEDGLIPCLTQGARVAVPAGTRCIEDLVVGDKVQMGEHGFQKIRWIGTRALDADDLASNPKLRPVVIKAGALGEGLPARDLLVSRQHRILVRSKVAERMFGASEVLVSAIKLTELPGIFVDERCDHVVYFHLLFDQHELIFAEGTPTESLFVGPEAFRTLKPEVREELTAIFPQIDQLWHCEKPARYIPSAKQQRRLVARHAKNNKPLLAADKPTTS